MKRTTKSQDPERAAKSSDVDTTDTIIALYRDSIRAIATTGMDAVFEAAWEKRHRSRSRTSAGKDRVAAGQKAKPPTLSKGGREVNARGGKLRRVAK